MVEMRLVLIGDGADNGKRDECVLMFYVGAAQMKSRALGGLMVKIRVCEDGELGFGCCFRKW